ncbi:2OG-Fe(II) oxygenase [Roseateles sp. BYS180W]|uniref:2OG-Fe(II) oxygenase n=1 Tax=Roseateles rivi TaxID=3299028 RepID=A0ABW7FVD5_9BURK
MTQSITPELRQWAQQQIAAGVSREALYQAMLSSGWRVEAASQVLTQLEQPAAHWVAAPRTPTALPKEGVPEPDLSAGRSVLEIDGHSVKVLLALQHPRVVVFGGFMTDAECDALAEAARGRLSRSETVATADEGSEVNAARTSEGMFFERGETELCARIEQRIARLLRWPVTHGEGLQVLRYRRGAEYLPHYDYFDPKHASSAAILKRGGQRVGTLVMYLNTPPVGGATVFPDIKLDVMAIKGNAVFFSYDRPDPGTLTLHGGAPVQEGEKWVATKWMREGAFE